MAWTTALAMRDGMAEAKRRAEHWEGAPRALCDAKIARLRDDLKG
ncbi:hypothetical protein [uncultured Thiodictyon sp.]|nr:hypothetical protein [uncultured Thiodictyon sp.]